MSNGEVDRYIGIIKQLMGKAEHSGKSLYIVLMEYQNTPITGLKNSPSQLAMSRQRRSKLPISAALNKSDPLEKQTYLPNSAHAIEPVIYSSRHCYLPQKYDDLIMSY